MKKYIKHLTVFFVSIIIIGLLIILSIPSQYNIQKHINIESTSNIIFEKIIENLKKNKNILITEEEPFIKIEYKEEKDQKKNYGEIVIENKQDSISLYWRIYGEWPFYMKWKNININNKISNNINKSLDEIKIKSEEIVPNLSDIKIIKTDSILCVYKQDTCENNISSCIKENLNQILNKIKKDSNKIKIKYPYFIYKENYQGKTVFETGLIINKNDTLSLINKKYYYSDSIITCIHTGGLETLELSKKKVRGFISDHDHKTTRPIEIFMKEDKIKLIYLKK